MEKHISGVIFYKIQIVKDFKEHIKYSFSKEHIKLKLIIT